MTTDQIIDHIKRRISVPASQIKYGNTDFIAFINNAQSSKIVPKLIDVDEKFFVHYEDIPLVASKTRYRIPKLAVCWSMQEVGYLDANGNYGVLPKMTRGTEMVGDTNNMPYGFYIEDGYIVTAPPMGTTVTGSLRVYFYRTLNDLTLVTNCGRVTVVTPVGINYQLTVDNAPVGLAAGAAVINGNSPYELIATEATAVVVGLNVTIAQSEFNTTPVVGDWVCQTGYTPVPHLPDAWHYILADLAARKCLIGNTDQRTLQLLDSDISDDLEGIKRVSQTRTKGSPRKRVARNPIRAAHR